MHLQFKHRRQKEYRMGRFRISKNINKDRISHPLGKLQINSNDRNAKQIPLNMLMAYIKQGNEKTAEMAQSR